MLYSVELRSQRFVCASSLNCGAKVVSFLQTAKLFGKNFHAKGKKVGFGAHSCPLRGIHGCHPGLAAPAAAGGGLSLRTAKAGSNLPDSRTESGRSPTANLGSKAFTKAVAAARCGLEAGQNGPYCGAVRPVSGRNRGRFATRSSRCRQRAGLQAVGGGGRYVGPERNILTTPGAPLAWQASLLTTKKIVKHTAMPLPSKTFHYICS